MKRTSRRQLANVIDRLLEFHCASKRCLCHEWTPAPPCLYCEARALVKQARQLDAARVLRDAGVLL